MNTAPRASSWRPSSFALSALAGLAGSVAIAGGGLWASLQAGEAEAMADVRSLTAVVAHAVVEPNLSADLLAGDPAAIERFDQFIEQRVLDDQTLRVKLWSADGTIVYSDEHRLIGEVHQLESDKSASLRSGNVVSETSLLDGPENRFEADLADRMLEVYLPVEGPAGEPLLYESYFAISPVTESADRIRNEFLPVVLIPLALVLALHLGLSWNLSRHLERNQAQQERLLRRAIESSDLERRRIASDLHDGVVQDLAGTAFALTAAAETAAIDHADLSRDLTVAATGARQSLQSLRSLLVEIYPNNLHEQGLETALSNLLAPSGELGIVAELSIRGEIERWPAQQTALVYRVIQESVRNAYRHAEASTLEITIDSRTPVTRVTIADNGIGFAEQTNTDGHLGLRLMSDLATDAGARFTIRSQPGEGTTVSLDIDP